jgi:hypothetical protein
MSRAGIAFVIITSLCVSACQKNNISPSKSALISSNDTLITDTLIGDTSVFDTLSYGDTIYSASVTGTERRIYPVVRPAKPGYFMASLPGLDIDSITGRINISKSESGLRYEVFYVSAAKEFIASTTITISGVDYQDRIYDLSSGLPEDQYAAPIFNMTPGAPLPCTYTGNGALCKFDETDINGDNIPDYIGANNSKLIIDTLTGIIDLKKSLAAGVFGPVPPGSTPMFLNGRKKDVTIYYRLGDGNTRTLKKITIRLVYYQSKALIPESMQLEINSRNQRYLLQPGSAASTDDDLLTLAYYYYSTPKRPPLIVLVSGY